MSAYRRDPQPGSCTSCCHGDLDGNEDKGTPVDIKEDDIVSSIHEALQFVSYYHPRDFIQHLSAAFAREESEAAKNAIAQILVSSRMAAIGDRP